MPSWLDRATLKEAQAADIANRGAVQVARLQQARADAEAATPAPPETPAVDFGSLVEQLSAPFRDASTPAESSVTSTAPSAPSRPDGVDFGVLTRSLGSIFRDPAPSMGMPRVGGSTASMSAPSVSGRVDGSPPAAGIAGTQSGDYSAIDNSSRESFVRTAWPYMLEAAGGNRDAAEMMLAAAISENGSVGTGKPFWANNFFGIKGQGTAGSSRAATHEVIDGQTVNMDDDFAAYNTPQEGFRAFFQFLEQNPRYADALARYRQTGDAAQLFRDANAAGYATDPQWADKVANIRANQVSPVTRGLSQQQPAPQATQQPQQQPTGAFDLNDVAKRYGGGSYVFGGGRDQRGFGVPGARDTDCSAFVSSVWQEQGLELPAHTDAAYSTLTGLGAQRVDVQDARPGDVVFYMGSGYGGNVSYHMGIYAGNGQVLDSSRSGQSQGVMVRPLTHAGGQENIVILRDPRVNGQADPRRAETAPPLQPSGLAESDQGQQIAMQMGQQQAPTAPQQPASTGLPETVAARWQERVGAEMTPEDLEQLRMLGVVA